MGQSGARPRDVKQWVICEDTGQQAANGVCPVHHGDACLIVVAWVDRRASLRAALPTELPPLNYDDGQGYRD